VHGEPHRVNIQVHSALALDAQLFCEHYAALTFVFWRQMRCHARDQITTAVCRVTHRAQIFSLTH